MSKVFHLILGGSEITERLLFEGDSKPTAKWETPENGGAITVELVFSSPADNEKILVLIDQDEAEQLLRTLQRYKDHDWSFEKLYSVKPKK